MLRGCFVYYEVVVCLVLASMVLLTIIIVATGSAIINNIDKFLEIFQELGIDASILEGILAVGTTVLIVLMIVVVAVFVVAIIAFTMIRKSMHEIINLIDTHVVPTESTVKGAVFMFIFAAFSIAMFVMNIMSGNAVAIISGLVQVVMFVLGGILMLTFNKTKKSLK